jgi:hypothetical protein
MKAQPEESIPIEYDGADVTLTISKPDVGWNGTGRWLDWCFSGSVYADWRNSVIPLLSQAVDRLASILRATFQEVLLSLAHLSQSGFSVRLKRLAHNLVKWLDT